MFKQYKRQLKEEMDTMVKEFCNNMKRELQKVKKEYRERRLAKYMECRKNAPIFFNFQKESYLVIEFNDWVFELWSI